VCLLALACGGETPEDNRSDLRPVVSHVVGYARGETTRTFSGSAETGRIVNLSFRNSGVVTVLEITLGQTIQRGQLLARLDNVTVRLAHEQAVSALNSAASQMNTARLALDRTRILYEAGTLSLSDYEIAKNAYRTARANHESAQRSVEIQAEQISYGLIFAPESGAIASVSVEEGENVGAGQLVAVLNAGSEIEIGLGLPESVITRVSQGLEASVSFAALPGRSFRGQVTEVSPSVNPSTATYPVRLTLDEPSPDIRPGMAASVTLDLAGDLASGNTLTVPAKAVAEDDQGRFVFLLETQEDGLATVRKRPVTVGRLTSVGFEILEGLVAGQRIATAGLQTLLDGQHVRLR
jgi:RND family efflux transporter MFP subunit